MKRPSAVAAKMSAGNRKISEVASLVDRIFVDLRDAIVDGELEPGSHLSIKALAEMYDVSVIPIREALARLLSTELVTMEANRGYFVSEGPTEEEYRQLVAARCAFEVLALSESIKHITAADVAEMRKLNDKMRRLDFSKSPNKKARIWRQLNWAFHFKLVALSKNKYFIKIHDDLQFDFKMWRNLADTQQGMDALAIQQHDSVVDALERRDVEEASRLLREHIETGLRYVVGTGATEQESALQ